MSLSWLKSAAKIGAVVFDAIQWVEKQLKPMTSDEKQDSAMSQIAKALTKIKEVAGVIHDVEVEAKVRALIDAYVALQNAIAAAAKK